MAAGRSILQTGEVWLAAYLLGFPIGILEDYAEEPIQHRQRRDLYPNSYGIQEGAFIVLGALVGLGPEPALAISLAIRIREVLIDVPGLIMWQHTEGRALIKIRNNCLDDESA